MKNMISTLVVLLSATMVHGQHFKWTQRSSYVNFTSPNNTGTSVDVDNSANVYVAGTTNGVTEFVMNGASGSLLSHPSGAFDMFLAKYSPSGDILWLTKPTGTTVEIWSVSMTVDKAHNCLYVAGGFAAADDSLDFDGHHLKGKGSQDVFLAKYDLAGNVIWAKCVGGSGADFASSVKTDADGNVYLGGSYESDTIQSGSSLLVNAGSRDVFLAKYDPSGNLAWMKGFGGSGFEGCGAISVDNTGALYATGAFDSNDLTFKGTTIASTGWSDMFVAKFDISGNEKWLKSASCIGRDYGSAIQVLKSGRIFVVGGFTEATMSFGTATLTSSGPAPGNDDISLFKIDTSGAVVWSARVGSADGRDIVSSVATDSLDNVILSGWYGGSTITFGATTYTRTPPFSDMALFLAKMDSGGNFIWSTSVGKRLTEVTPQSIALAQNGDVYTTGSFKGDTVRFGDSTFTGTFGREVFVSKLDQISIVSIENCAAPGSLLSVFPNPATNTLRLSYSEKIRSLKVMNVLGRVVYTDTPNADTKEIDVSSLPSGLYHIVVNETITVKASKL